MTALCTSSYFHHVSVGYINSLWECVWCGLWCAERVGICDRTQCVLGVGCGVQSVLASVTGHNVCLVWVVVCRACWHLWQDTMHTMNGCQCTKQWRISVGIAKIIMMKMSVIKGNLFFLLTMRRGQQNTQKCRFILNTLIIYFQTTLQHFYNNYTLHTCDLFTLLHTICSKYLNTVTWNVYTIIMTCKKTINRTNHSCSNDENVHQFRTLRSAVELLLTPSILLQCSAQPHRMVQDICFCRFHR
jgi:hypothetical protein